MKCYTIGSITSVFLVFLQWLNHAESILVRIEQGWLRGEIKMTSTNMGKYYSFKGIPYATPPLEKLRFKAPQPPDKWNGIRNATEHGSICMQPTTFLNSTAIGSEDCLYLNVYTPELKPDRLLSVMFFIHGGIFITGSGNSDVYGADFLMPHGVVLVTVNYRLGAFGFMAIDTPEVPGNAGLKDNIAALQWVQKNINKFGGNPDCVTIFGQSAGSAMAALHVLSPAAKNLFQRAILMSGSPFSDWSTEFETRRRAFAHARVLGLDTNDPYEVTRFLQSVPAKDLVEVHPNFPLSDKKSNQVSSTTYYPPNIERKFGNGTGQYLTTNPTILICSRQINPVDVMMGHTASEGSKTTTEMEDVYLKNYQIYNELLVPLKIRLFRSPRKVLELADRVKRFYFKNETISRNNILDVIHLNSYLIYVFDIHVYIGRLPKLPRVRRYLYRFDIFSSRNVYGRAAAEKYGIEKATHRDDLGYLLDGSFNNQTIDVNSKVFQYIQLMCKLYTNFAKYGNPTPDKSLGQIWPEFDQKRGAMVIGRNGNLTTGTVSTCYPDLKFWRDLYRSTGINIF